MENTLNISIEEKKLTPDEVSKEFININSKLIDLYGKRRELIEYTIMNEDPTSFDGAPLIVDNGDGTWTRVTIYDNVERLMEKGFYEHVKIEKYTVEIKTLKNKPKELR